MDLSSLFRWLEIGVGNKVSNDIAFGINLPSADDGFGGNSAIGIVTVSDFIDIFVRMAFCLFPYNLSRLFFVSISSLLRTWPRPFMKFIPAGTSSAVLHTAVPVAAVQDTDTAGRSPGMFRLAGWPEALADIPVYRAGKPAAPAGMAGIPAAPAVAAAADIAGMADSGRAVDMAAAGSSRQRALAV